MTGGLEADSLSPKGDAATSLISDEGPSDLPFPSFMAMPKRNRSVSEPLPSIETNYTYQTEIGLIAGVASASPSAFSPDTTVIKTGSDIGSLNNYELVGSFSRYSTVKTLPWPSSTPNKKQITFAEFRRMDVRPKSQRKILVSLVGLFDGLRAVDDERERAKDKERERELRGWEKLKKAREKERQKEFETAKNSMLSRRGSKTDGGGVGACRIRFESVNPSNSYLEGLGDGGNKSIIKSEAKKKLFLASFVKSKRKKKSRDGTHFSTPWLSRL